MAIEITKVYKEHFPPLRFIGKRYTNDDRDSAGGFGKQWGEWMSQDRFTQLKVATPAVPFDESTIGLMTMRGDMTGFTYWVGLFFPERTAVPDGFDHIDLPASDIGVGWVCGKEENGEIYGDAHGAVCTKLEKEGVGKFRNDISGQGSDTYCFFERYTCPRFTEKDENGNVTLDYGNYFVMDKNEIAFNMPFSGFAGTTFINCFTSTYMFLEDIALGASDYDCNKMLGEPCNSCGNCDKGGSTPAARQESFFFLFDTMCGHSALRYRFDGEPTQMQRMICETDFYDAGTDNNIDFLFGFTGYEYQALKESDKFKAAIIASIDVGKPVIAKMKTGDDRFRVITGYDGDGLICPNYANAQRRPERAPTYDELDKLFIIGEKTAPRYTLLDGLKRIEQVLAYNDQVDIWHDYTEKIGLYTSDSLRNVSLEEKKARMKRVADTMWHTFNCHNFAEVFRKYREGGDPGFYSSVGDMDKLCDPRFKEHFDRISGPFYGYTHDLAWALIGLEGCADWSKHASGYFGEMVELTLSQIAKNDRGVLGAIREIIGMLEAGAGA